MSFFVRVLDEDGRFELLDGTLAVIYPNVDFDELPMLSDEQYAQWCQQGDQHTRYLDGQLVFAQAAINPSEIKAAQQAEMWERIKTKRHDNLRGGVYIQSIGKWMHTNDESRTQYLALGLLPQLPPDLQWKTMENDFVPMSKALLQEIYLTMLADEQADFANAERHKAAMEAADNPLEYDYSDGWAQTYQPAAPSAPVVTETAQEPPAVSDGDTQADAAAAPVTDPEPSPPEESEAEA